MSSPPTFDRGLRIDYTANRVTGLFSRIKIWWLLIALFLFVQENGLFSKQNTTNYDLGSLSGDAETTGLLRLLTASLWIILLAIILPRIHIAFGTLIRQRAIVATMLYAIISSSWSQIPYDSLRRATLLSLTLIFGSYLVSTFSPETQMRLLLVTGVIVALASIGMVVIFPEYGLSSDGEWKGIFGHKNRLALGMLFLFCGLPFSPLSTSRQKFWCALQGVIALSMILLSRSKTSLILVVIVVGVGLFSRFAYRLRRDQLPVVFLGAASVLLMLLWLMTTNLGGLADFLGKDVTLSGRTRNWAILLTFAARHFWLGYGYQGFWTGATGDSGSAIAGIGGVMKGADNGYIDVSLELGIVGLVLLFLIFLDAARNFVRILRRPSVPLATFWYAAILLILFVGDFTETLFWEPSHVSTLFLVIACAGLQRLALDTPNTLLEPLRGNYQRLPSKLS